jgi:hypothetical protein
MLVVPFLGTRKKAPEDAVDAAQAGSSALFILFVVSDETAAYWAIH